MTGPIRRLLRFVGTFWDSHNHHHVFDGRPATLERVLKFRELAAKRLILSRLAR
jgi:hypothetical protein